MKNPYQASILKDRPYFYHLVVFFTLLPETYDGLQQREKTFVDKWEKLLNWT